MPGPALVGALVGQISLLPALRVAHSSARSPYRAPKPRNPKNAFLSPKNAILDPPEKGLQKSIKMSKKSIFGELKMSKNGLFGTF